MGQSMGQSGLLGEIIILEPTVTRTSIPSVVHPLASRFTDGASAAPGKYGLLKIKARILLLFVLC
jgi:hypothetical protein